MILLCSKKRKPIQPNNLKLSILEKYGCPKNLENWPKKMRSQLFSRVPCIERLVFSLVLLETLKGEGLKLEVLGHWVYASSDYYGSPVGLSIFFTFQTQSQQLVSLQSMPSCVVSPHTHSNRTYQLQPQVSPNSKLRTKTNFCI